jgi:hypothetical protein
MNYLLSIIFLWGAFILISYNQYSDIEQLKQEIIEADQNMSDLASKGRFLKAILVNADDSIIKFNEVNIL